MNNMQTLRDSMFSTLKGIQDGKISIDQAKVMAELGQVLINSAKVEVDFIKANNGGKSKFLQITEDEENQNEVGEITETLYGTKTIIGGRTVHKIR